MTKKQTLRLLAILQGAYPRQQLPDSSLVIYHKALYDLSWVHVQEAAVVLIQTGDWFPTIAQIRKVVTERNLNLPTTSFCIGQFSMDNFTWPGMPDIVREALHAVGGSWAFKNSTTPGFWRRDFKQHYEELRDEMLHNEQSPVAQLPAGEAPKLLGD